MYSCFALISGIHSASVHHSEPTFSTNHKLRYVLETLNEDRARYDRNDVCVYLLNSVDILIVVLSHSKR